MERGTFFHLLGATGEGEGGGGPSKGLLFLPAEASKGSREKGGRDKPEKLFRAWRGRERERERERESDGKAWVRQGASLPPLVSWALRSPTADLSREKEEGGLLLRDRGREDCIYREPLCVLQYVYAPFLGRHHLLLQLKSNKPKVQQRKKKGLGSGGEGVKESHLAALPFSLATF